MRVRNPALSLGEFDQLLVAPAVPEHERQDPHEAAVAERGLLREAGLGRGDAIPDAFERLAGRAAGSEGAASSREVAVVEPAHEALAEILRVELAALEERR